MVTYYAQRASGGLLIAEASMVTPKTGAFWKEPDMYSAAQIAVWKRVAEAVQANTVAVL